ncbi:MAG: ABC transporter ATP-binding protein/permease [Streptococcaceae bacterium]|jgi:ABC-type bacteriocin/lantibiotic exporter with double-glycine peptidase domain|nr:ABC transporter ATP-binding protein/permease [Streptococcaceae bacterium]
MIRQLINLTKGKAINYTISAIIISLQNSLLTIGMALFIGGLSLKNSKLSSLSIKLIFFLFFTTIINYIFKIFLLQSTENIRLKIKANVYQKILNLPLNSFTTLSKADLLNFFHDDVEEITHFYEFSLIHLLSLILGIISSNLYLLKINLFLAFVNFSLGFLSFIYFNKIRKKIKKQANFEKKSAIKSNNFLFSMINGKKFIDIFSLKKMLTAKHSETVKENKINLITLEKSKALFVAINAMFMIFTFIIMMFLSFYLERMKIIRQDVAISCIIISSGMIWMYRSLSDSLITLPKVKLSLDRYKTIMGYKTALDLKNEFALKTNYLKSDLRNNAIFLSNIEVCDLNGRPIINKINYALKKNSIVGIYGENGVGKTTLLRTIMGLDIPRSGKMFVNGRSFAQADLNSWKKQFIYISQTPNLLEGNVYDNISMGFSYSKEEIEKAARLSNVHEIVNNLPQRYDTKISDEILSSGEIQRICLARAFINLCDFLLLDEPTCALDENNEQIFLDSLKNLVSKKTIIVVSHRTKVFSYCEKIYEMIKITKNETSINKLILRKI